MITILGIMILGAPLYFLGRAVHKKLLGGSIKQLPEITSKEDKSMIENQIIVEDKSIGKMLLQSAKEALYEEEILKFNLRKSILSSKELPGYFKNIWKTLKENESRSNSFLISQRHIGCEEKDYDMVVNIFNEALKEIDINIGIEKHTEYWFFKIDGNSLNRLLYGKIQSMDEVRLQLSQGEPYR